MGRFSNVSEAQSRICDLHNSQRSCAFVTDIFENIAGKCRLRIDFTGIYTAVRPLL
jgi:hypothetical protein